MPSEPLTIKGLNEQGNARFWSDITIQEAFKRGGMIAAWRKFEMSNLASKLRRTSPALEPLVEWGFDAEAARLVLSIYNQISHEDLAEYGLKVLHDINGIPSRWPATVSGRPVVGMSLDEFYYLNIERMLLDASGMDSTLAKDPVVTVTIHKSAAGIPKLPQSDDEYLRLYCATSWYSAYTMSLEIDPFVNQNEEHDFGHGFYLTDSVELVKVNLCSPLNHFENQPVLLVFKFPLDQSENLDIYQLDDEEWPLVVENCRTGLASDPIMSCDIIIGRACKDVQSVNMGSNAIPDQRPFNLYCFKTFKAAYELELECAHFLQAKTPLKLDMS